MTTSTPAAEFGSQAIPFTRDVLIRDARWIAGAALLYSILVIVATFTLNPYFSQTWDAVTFVNAGKSILSPEWSTLYAQSRAGSYWAYAYPPLHAVVVAPFIALAGLLADYLLVRLPPLVFDIALGVLLYAVIARKTQTTNLARLALLVWLLNPVTWYDTAVQGHFEAEWLFFVVLAYALAEWNRARSLQQHWVLPTLAFAVAFLFKQNAVLFAMPFWAQLFINTDEKNVARRALPVLGSMVVFAIPIVTVSLPFLLSSNDYWYMNVQYVAEVPLQTQSWLVALAGVFGADNVLVRGSSLLTFAAAALISLLAVRRGMSLWLAATLIVLAFFLVSKKVVGYYYVMLLPFALLTLVPAQRFRLLSLVVVAIAFISLSPYFASWANQERWWVYGLLGSLNSALWLGILVWLWRNHPLPTAPEQNARTPAFLSVALFLAAAAAALVQPFIASESSPIRAPLWANEAQALLALLAFGLLAALALGIGTFYARTIARGGQIPTAAYALVVLLTPLYFLTFTLTKESTAALESFLNRIGQ